MISLLQGDARELIHTLPDDPYYIITDPPFGIGLMSHGGSVRRGDRPAFRERETYLVAGDESQCVGQSVLDSLARYPVCVFASPEHPWRGDWRQYLVWDKGPAVGIGGDRKTCWKASWELIQVSRRFPEVFGTRDEAILRFPITPDNYADHPCAKPLPLMRYLIRKLVPPDGVVLDPFAGSGRTLVAALQVGRRAVGIEVDDGYYAVARRAVDHAYGDRPGSLFAGLSGPEWW